jgi:PEGA domain/SmpA / OmlA family
MLSEASEHMRKRIAIGISMLMLTATIAAAQGKENPANQRAVLEQILTQTYQPSVVGKMAVGIGGETSVRRAGIVVVVQRPGLFGGLQRNETASTAVHGLDAQLFRGNKDYPIPAGERFYVTTISVGGETVFFGLLSARTVTTPRGTGRVWAVATFYFPSETLANADKDAVIRELDQWFVPEGRAPTVGAASAISSSGATPAATTAPQPAPQSSVAAQLAQGMTREQVLAAMGRPQGEVSFGVEAWMNYPGLVIKMKDDKLSSVQDTGQVSAKVSVQSDPSGAEIYFDGQLVGSTPSTLEAPAGNHQVSIRLNGYAEWTRELHVLAGSDIHLNSNLEKK